MYTHIHYTHIIELYIIRIYLFLDAYISNEKRCQKLDVFTIFLDQIDMP